MAEQFQTSFIPKKTFDVGAPTKQTPSSVAGIISFVAVILFVLSAVSAVGVFFYERFLIASIANKQETLERAKSAFEPELIRELSRLDDKFAIGRRLLDEHVAPSGVLDLLEDITLATVRYNSFAYLVDEIGPRITLQGTGRTFSSIALQSDEFARNRSLREPVFSGLDLDERGNVSFSATALIDPVLVSYRERAARGGTALIDMGNDEAVAGASISIE